MCLRIRGWRRVGLGVKMGVFKDQVVETVGLGVKMGVFKDQGWRRVGLGVKMGVFKDQVVETGRFRGEDGCV